MEKDEKRAEDGALEDIEIEKDVTGEEDQSLSPNELLFGKAEEEEKQEKKGFCKKKIVIAAVALIIAVSVVISLVIMNVNGSLREITERYIYSPEEQLSEVLKRHAKEGISAIKESDDTPKADSILRHNGSIGVDIDADEYVIDTLEYYLGLASYESYIELINGIKLYYSLYADSDGAGFRLDLDEDGGSLGFAGIYERKPDALYLAIPAFTEALFGGELGFDLYIPEIGIGAVSKEEKEALLELSDTAIEGLAEKVGKVERKRTKETYYQGQWVECDTLSFEVDRESAVCMMDHLISVAEEERELTDGVIFGGYDALLELKENILLILPEDFSLSVKLIVNDGKIISYDLEEMSSGLWFVREESGYVSFKGKVYGLPISVGGNTDGVYSVSVLGVHLAEITVKDLTLINGIPDGEVTVALSKEVLGLISVNSGDPILEDYLSRDSIIRELVRHRLVFDFEAEGDNYHAQISLMDPETKKDVISLVVDGDANGDAKPYDTEGKESYSPDSFEAYRETITLTKKLLDAIKAMPEGLRGLLDERLMSILDSGIYNILSDDTLDKTYGGELDRYLDPILDVVGEFLEK